MNKRENIIEKDYLKWSQKKSELNNSGITRSIREGDVFWAAMGENIGVEIDGKNEKYSRPVLVLKKYNRYCFMGVPLTTKIKEKGDWYVEFEFQGHPETAVVFQARFMDTEWLYQRIGRLSVGDFKKVKTSFLNLFRDKNVPQPKD